MAAEAGRDPETLPVTIGGSPEDPDRVKRFRDLGAARVNVSLPAENADQILPVLDRWASLIRQLRVGIKVLGDGELNTALTVQAHKFSKSAEEKIAKAGGKVEILP